MANEESAKIPPFPDTENTMTDEAEVTATGGRIFKISISVALSFVAFFFMIFLVFAILRPPPTAFVRNTLVTIPEGYSLNAITKLLGKERIVRSAPLLNLLVRLSGNERNIPAGEYLFEEPMDVFVVTDRLLSGAHGIQKVRITIPEGTSVAGIGRILSKTFARFDEVQFAALTKGSEGYLFPDTYFFYSTATSGPIVETLKNNFLLKADALYREALSSEKNWSDVIIMASIIEEETITPADRRIVSGILWKRLAKKMYLQVDAPFAYDIGKNSATLTLDDLKIDSPYNTYRNYGLPPTPISNPGLDAIDASLHPEASPYYFYLSGKDGVIHYAKTFEEHKVNKERYLR